VIQQKPPLDELVHQGVKGMRWGVRKKKNELPMHRSYKVQNRAADKSTFGPRGVNRINKRMHKGQSYKKALTMEFVHSTAKATVGAGAIAAATILSNNGGLLATSVASKAQTNRGRAQAAATMGLPRKPTNGPTYSAKSRQGVHKITSL
jgi:hypothetical protein